jgi:LCP family protein required for cell wall assembly
MSHTPPITSAEVDRRAPSTGARHVRRHPSFRDRRRDRRERRRARRAGKRQWPRRVAIALASLVLLGALAGLGGWLYARWRFDQIHKIHAKHLVRQVTKPGAPFDLLVVGSDSRAFVDNTREAQAFGSASVQGGQRSDVTMVVRIIPATKQVWVLSIPRDLWVDIPGNVRGVSGMNRINVAFDSGPDLLVQTVEQDLYLPVNHYVAVNFPGFEGMVNALGGITMNFPDDLRDSYSGLQVTQTGCQMVNGAEALALVRSRHLSYRVPGAEWLYDGLSDFSRIQRQDAFFRAVLDKLNASITNPLAVNSFLAAAAQNLTIDDTLSEGALFHLATELRGLPPGNLHFETLPTTSFVTSGGADVLRVAQPYAEQMIAAFDARGTNAAAPPTTTTTEPIGTGGGSTTTEAPTTTTIPGNVYTNTQAEPWNPAPC